MLITPFPANHREVQQNCEITMMGNIVFDLLIYKANLPKRVA
ncbi:hypothetical protein PHEL49_2010 [Polaribacter sp. Hel1_33_49]|nr:hypothetical protein PHEL49_2010 [Polaribacter sp. Hel1_33_49]